MQISDEDATFAVGQIWRQLEGIRESKTAIEVGVLAPRCLGFICALAMVGVINQRQTIRLNELALNAWTYAGADTRNQQRELT